MILGAAAMLGAATPGMSFAHMPYLLPNYFAVSERDHVTVSASFTEDLFSPDVVMKSDAWLVHGPAGPTPIKGVTYLRDLAAFETALPAPGTYRISSGERLGRKAKMYKADNGQWTMGGEGAEPPAGVTLVDVQSVTVAEVYVTRDAPSPEALTPTGKSLEVKPITHPNEIFAKALAGFELLFEGKPLSGATVTVYRAAGAYDGKKVTADVTTDAAGRFKIEGLAVGAYEMEIWHERLGSQTIGLVVADGITRVVDVVYSATR